jgi:hypothetical protein
MQLLDLPNEVLDEIATYLPYPDQLSLKLTSTYWHSSIQPSVRDRINWLLSRARSGLPFPQSQKCSFRSDALFCSNPEVRRILRDRRSHVECLRHARNGSCLVTDSYMCRQSSEPRITSRSRNFLAWNFAMIIQLVHVHAFTIFATWLCTILERKHPIPYRSINI